MFSIGGHNYEVDDKLEICYNKPFYHVVIGDDGEIVSKTECWSEEDFIRSIQAMKKRRGNDGREDY